MDQEQAIKLLSERLDTYDDPQVVFVDCISWFAEDFSRFKKPIVNEILRRIRNPPILPQKHIKQPILPLYYLVDAISKNCDHGYSQYFGEKLPQVFEQSLYLNDKHLNDKLFGLVDYWKSENIFSESDIESLQSSIRAYKESKGQSMNPVPENNPLPQNPVTFIPSINQMPTNNYMQPSNQNVEIIEPSIDDTSNQMSIAQDQSSTMDFSIQNEKERRLSREWMKSSALWVHSKNEPNEFLIRDLDADENQRFNEQSTPMVRLTPENANERCYSCSGTFDTVVGPNGEECLKDAIYVEGKGYIHLRCKQLQAEDSTQEFLQTVLLKK